MPISIAAHLLLLSSLTATARQEAPSLEESPEPVGASIGLGGNPIESEYWLEAVPYLWDEITHFHKGGVESPGLLWCSTGPEDVPEGRMAALELLEATFRARLASPLPETVAALMEVGWLRGSDMAAVLEAGSEDATAAVMRSMREGSGPVSPTFLIERFNQSSSPATRLAALHGIGRAMEYASGTPRASAPMKSVLEWAGDSDLDSTLRAASLEIAGQNLLSYGAGLHPEASWTALFEIVLEVLQPRTKRDALVERKAQGALLECLESVPSRMKASLDLDDLRGLLESRLAFAVDRDEYGEALVGLASFYGLALIAESPEQSSHAHKFMGQLSAALDAASPEEGAWVALAYSTLFRGAATRSEALAKGATSLVRLIERASASGDLERYVPSLRVVGLEYSERLLAWVLNAKEGGERGRRLRAMALASFGIQESEMEQAARGYESDESFMVAAAPALAIATQPKSAHFLLSDALRKGAQLGWSERSLARLIDALGAEPTDEASESLRWVLNTYPAESLPARRAALAIGRMYEKDVHRAEAPRMCVSHPFRPEIYRCSQQ